MSKTREDAEKRGCVKSGGREYVNLTICAQRLGIAKASLSEATKDGKFTKVSLEGYRGLWYDWELTRMTFNRLRKNPKRGGSREKPKDATIFAPGKVADAERPPIPSDEVTDIGMPAMPKGDILDNFDPEAPENADCWEVSESGEFLYVPGTGKHYVDWKKAINKCMAQIRYQQYQERQGELIPKTDVLQTLSKVFPPITASVMQIPDRFASRLAGRLEEMTGRSMTNEEKTVLRSVLNDEAEQIAHNLQQTVEEIMDDKE